MDLYLIVTILVQLVGLLAIGFLTCLGLHAAWSVVYLPLLAPALGHGVDWKALPRWAVVTGSTDGIGRAYAEQLAKKGFNIVLISRNQKKLDLVKEGIGLLADVKIKTIAVDFSDGPQIYDTIRKGLEGLDVGVLVNNVGMNVDFPEFYTLLPGDDKFVSDIVNTNVLSCSMMMRLVLPQMSSCRSGVIINVSSMLAFFICPLLSVYGATKSYIDYLSQALQFEYQSKNIIIQTVLPGYVKSNMARFRETSLFVPSADTFVHWALKSVGIEKRTTGYPPHNITKYFRELVNFISPPLLQSFAFSAMVSNRRSFYARKKVASTSPTPETALHE